jgi:hypothetical protein
MNTEKEAHLLLTAHMENEIHRSAKEEFPLAEKGSMLHLYVSTFYSTPPHLSLSLYSYLRSVPKPFFVRHCYIITEASPPPHTNHIYTPNPSLPANLNQLLIPIPLT